MMVERKVGNKVMRLVRGDITDMEVEAFVFDITEDCKLGSGYGGAVAARGGKVIQEELDKIGRLATTEAAVTTAGKMKAKHIVHVNGPKFMEDDTAGKLRKTAEAALRWADEKGFSELAFPPIGTGMYQVPLDLCAEVLVDTVERHLRNGRTSLTRVDFVALDSREEAPLKTKLKGS